MKIFNSKKLKPIRKSLRNNPTDPEYRLWYFLRNSQLCERKFRRQHSIGKYIVDFYCAEEKLAIELDGAAHYEVENIKYDMRRSLFLKSLGIRVIRFRNEDVLYNTDFVLRQIQNNFLTTSSRKRATPP